MKNRAAVLLSGEGTTIPEAEARALFLAYDPGVTLHSAEDRMLVAETSANVESVASRVAYARRVGLLLENASDVAERVKQRRVSFRCYSLPTAKGPAPVPGAVLKGLDVSVDLEDPEFEFTLVRGNADYLMLTRPAIMRQGWSLRRPRKRAFFHPSAIFPKLSRALVNLTRVKEGETLMDPFAGTGSILLEAGEVGVRAVALDQSSAMVRGALANMHMQGQEWLGVIRGDAFRAPVRVVDAIATDVPYGRASTTRGRMAADVVSLALERLPSSLKSGGRLLLMHPKQIAVTSTREVEIEEEHDIYIHKKLTRTITILRRR